MIPVVILLYRKHYQSLLHSFNVCYWLILISCPTERLSVTVPCTLSGPGVVPDKEEESDRLPSL